MTFNKSLSNTDSGQTKVNQSFKSMDPVNTSLPKIQTFFNAIQYIDQHLFLQRFRYKNTSTKNSIRKKRAELLMTVGINIGTVTGSSCNKMNYYFFLILYFDAKTNPSFTPVASCFHSFRHRVCFADCHCLRLTGVLVVKSVVNSEMHSSPISVHRLREDGVLLTSALHFCAFRLE